MTEPLLRAEHVRATRHGLDLPDLTLSVRPGHAVALVGPAATLAVRVLARLHPIQGGKLWLAGRDITRVEGNALRAMRRVVQWVGGHPAHSLEASERVLLALTAGLRYQNIGREADRQRTALAVAEACGLNAHVLTQTVRQLSMAQRQRVRLAQALALAPQLLLLDDLTTTLDPQAVDPLLDTLRQQCTQRGLAWVWAAPNLALAERYASTIILMKEAA